LFNKQYIIARRLIMGCGCGGGGARRQARAPRLPANNNNAVSDTARLHPSVANMQKVQKLAEERRKLGRLHRERLLKAISKP
jgi:hypothetical protein